MDDDHRNGVDGVVEWNGWNLEWMDGWNGVEWNTEWSGVEVESLD